MEKRISYITLILQVIISIPAPTTQSSIRVDDSWESVNASCPPYDSCATLPQDNQDNLVARNCECGTHCNEYETCCIDSSHRRPYTGRRRQTCIKVHGVQQEQHGFFMVDECRPRWRGNPRIRDMCHASPNNMRDPYVLVPAWNSRRNTTYRNFACGVCNNVHPDDLKMWDVSLYKSASNARNYTSDEILASLTYNRKLDSWGLRERIDTRRRRVFVKITLAAKPPSASNETPKRCIPDLVEDCSSMWTDQETIDNCRAYMAPIGRKAGDSFTYYRNVHCASCNFVKMSVAALKCWEPIPIAETTTSREYGDTSSLTFLFDINLNYGNVVNKVLRQPCQRGEAYDQFVKKCRSLVCGLPALVILEGRCVRS